MAEPKTLPCTLYLASGKEVKVPYLADLLSFVHNDMQIRNPMRSECGRFAVDPQQYGFREYHTGGGCMALIKELPCGEYFLLTDDSGINIPDAEDWETAQYCRHYGDGDPAILIELGDVPLACEE